MTSGCALLRLAPTNTDPSPFGENAARWVPERDARISERFGRFAGKPSVKDLVHIEYRRHKFSTNRCLRGRSAAQKTEVTDPGKGGQSRASPIRSHNDQRADTAGPPRRNRGGTHGDDQ